MISREELVHQFGDMPEAIDIMTENVLQTEIHDLSHHINTTNTTSPLLVTKRRVLEAKLAELQTRKSKQEDIDLWTGMTEMRKVI